MYTLFYFFFLLFFPFEKFNIIHFLHFHLHVDLDTSLKQILNAVTNVSAVGAVVFPSCRAVALVRSEFQEAEQMKQTPLNVIG